MTREQGDRRDDARRPFDVTIAGCEDYEPARVRAALVASLEPWGGIEAFVRPGERIGLKPNLLLATDPERGITTNPVVVEAVIALVHEAGAQPVLIESAGAGMPQRRMVMDRTLRRTGMRRVLDRTGVEAAVDGDSTEVSFPDARLTPRLDLLTACLDVDGLINLPRLKTHTFMTFTGAVKNLFGFVPGLHKAGYHAKLADADHFADMLLDIAGFLAPRLRLNVMDAVTGLEGDGPGTGGRAVSLGYLIAGPDAVLVDAAACRAAGIPPSHVPTLTRAADRGLWDGDSGLLEAHLDGMDEWPSDRIAQPKRALDPTGLNSTGRVQQFLRRLANDTLNVRPRPRPGRCTGCRSCERACPVGAITVVDRLAQVADDRCIRCYCCHEFCPEAAIDLELGRMGKAAQRLGLM